MVSVLVISKHLKYFLLELGLIILICTSRMNIFLGIAPTPPLTTPKVRSNCGFHENNLPKSLLVPLVTFSPVYVLLALCP